MRHQERNVSNHPTPPRALDYQDESKVTNTPNPTLQQNSATVVMLVLGVPFGLLLGVGTAASLSWARPPLWIACLALAVLFATSLSAAHFVGKRRENGLTSILQGVFFGFILVLLLLSMEAVDALIHRGPRPFRKSCPRRMTKDPHIPHQHPRPLEYRSGIEERSELGPLPTVDGPLIRAVIFLIGLSIGLVVSLALMICAAAVLRVPLFVFLFAAGAEFGLLAIARKTGERSERRWVYFVQGLCGAGIVVMAAGMLLSLLYRGDFVLE